VLHQTAVPTSRMPKATHPAMSVMLEAPDWPFSASPPLPASGAAAPAVAAPAVADPAAAAPAAAEPLASEAPDAALPRMLEMAADTESMALLRGAAPSCSGAVAGSRPSGAEVDGGKKAASGVEAGASREAADPNGAAVDSAGEGSSPAGCATPASATIRSAAAIGGASSSAAARLPSMVMLMRLTICLAVSKPCLAASVASASACL